MNLQLAFNILNTFYNKGVRTFCIAPGGRNAPFVEILSRSNLSVFYFYDERSMAFFAHGRSRRDGAPVVVITTSGTAVCELLPAVVESYYSSSSLVLITADRPKEYQGTGAPQVIEQDQIFSRYVSSEKSFSVQDLQDPLDLSHWNAQNSIHWNVHFDEPLVDEQVLKNEVPVWINKNWSASQNSLKTPLRNFNANEAATLLEQDAFWLFFQSSSKPVILVSCLPYELRGLVEDFLLSLNCPVYLEPLSQLRENSRLQKLALKSGNSIFKKAFDQNLFDGVIRIGGIPVLKFWRDLNDWNVPVISFSLSSLSGLKKRSKALPLLTFLKKDSDWVLKNEILHSSKESFLNLDSSNTQKATEEGKWIHWLSQQIPPSSLIFLGNSLPIREWDMFAIREDKKFRYAGNRGANGIDGILSSFLGQCLPDAPNYCILGDLSALYDFSSPWILKQLEKYFINIVVINNFGGQIFKNKFQNPAFLNNHQLDFSHFAGMWNLNYQRVVSLNESLKKKSHSLIEIQVSS